MNTIQLDVQGMHCGGCVKRVTAALQPLPGVGNVDVDLAASRVTVGGVFPQGPEHLVLALTAAGYPAKVAAEGATASQKSGGCCG